MKKTKLKIDVPISALNNWKPEIKAADEDDDKVPINVYDIVGEDMFSSGMTARVVSSILRQAKGHDVVVNINSPGGDVFEGFAIYNLLKEYEGNVEVKVLGLAASAASVIAMAGDTIRIAESGFIMIHNAWTLAVGNKHDMQAASETLSKIDEALLGIYAKRMPEDENIVAHMDAETWFASKDALELNLVDEILSDEVQKEDEASVSALRKADIALAKAGYTRAERRKLFQDIKDDSTPSAADPTPSAGEDLCHALSDLLNTIKG